MKIVKIYIDDEFIKSKLGDEYKDSQVIFRNAVIGIDNTLTFECIIGDECVADNDGRRIKVE